MPLDGIADIQSRIAAIEQRCNAVGTGGVGSSSPNGGTTPLGASAFSDVLAAAMNNGDSSTSTPDDGTGAVTNQYQQLMQQLGLGSNGATGSTGANQYQQLLAKLGISPSGASTGALGSTGLGALGLTGLGSLGTAGMSGRAVTGTGAPGFVAQALAEAGKPYVFGAQANANDPNPKAFDCAELVQWAAARNGVALPDGSWNQYLHLKAQGQLVPVDQAIHTPGALLFSFSTEPTPGGGRPSHAHVAISLGDGRTIEAKGKAYGVGSWDAANRFQWAAVVPGLR